MANIQEAIRRLIEAGMTQEQIGAHVGIGQAAISKLAKGQRKDMLHSNALRLEELVALHCPKEAA